MQRPQMTSHVKSIFCKTQQTDALYLRKGVEGQDTPLLRFFFVLKNLKIKNDCCCSLFPQTVQRCLHRLTVHAELDYG